MARDKNKEIIIPVNGTPKMYMIGILKILEKYSDADHPLTQTKIAELFESNYKIKIDRHTVADHLEDLERMGYNIMYTEAKRGKYSDDIDVIKSKYYLIRDFEDYELRLLIDSLLFSKYVPDAERMNLIDKVKRLSNEYFDAKIDHVKTMPTAMPDDIYDKQHLFRNIELLIDAIYGNKALKIEPGRKVKFHTKSYNSNLKLEYDLYKNTGNKHNFTVSPYEIAIANSRYYLICSHNRGDNVFYYKLDYIYNMEILKDDIRPMSEITELKNGLNLPKHMSEHIYMFSGESVDVWFRAYIGPSDRANDKIRITINDIVEWFGKDITINADKESENHIIVKVSVNEQAMLYWALQYGKAVKILSPDSLVERIRKAVEYMCGEYGVGEENNKKEEQNDMGKNYWAMVNGNLDDSIWDYFLEISVDPDIKNEQLYKDMVNKLCEKGTLPNGDRIEVVKDAHYNGSFQKYESIINIKNKSDELLATIWLGSDYIGASSRRGRNAGLHYDNIIKYLTEACFIGAYIFWPIQIRIFNSNSNLTLDEVINSNAGHWNVEKQYDKYKKCECLFIRGFNDINGIGTTVNWARGGPDTELLNGTIIKTLYDRIDLLLYDFKEWCLGNNCELGIVYNSFSYWFELFQKTGEGRESIFDGIIKHFELQDFLYGDNNDIQPHLREIKDLTSYDGKDFKPLVDGNPCIPSDVPSYKKYLDGTKVVLNNRTKRILGI